VDVPSDGPPELSFGPFRLDRQRRRLTRGGAVIPLGGRAVEVLAVLAAAAGEPVAKNVLLEKVWPGLTVEENNLQVQISNLRKTLGEGWIVNLPGRGYRLAVVTEGEVSPTDEVASKPSIAVLPFTNMTGDREQEYFADGVVEDIITALARTGWLFVIARNSSFSYKGTFPDVRVVGRELGVRYVLEGSIRRAGVRVRIACQLIEAATGGHLWAERFEGEIADIFDLQDRISESVVGAMEPNLRRAEIVRATVKPTVSMDAYDFYLRALPHFYRFARDGTQTAMELLRRALALESNYSRAKALLGWVHVIRISGGWADADEVSQAVRLAEAVLETDPDDSSTIAMAAQILGYIGPDIAVARMAADRALSLSPNSAQVLLAAGWVYSHAGDATAAIDFFQRGIRLSPRDPTMPVFLSGIGMAYLQAGRNEDALEAFRNNMLQHPYPVPLRGLITVLIRLGRFDEARSAGVEMLRLWPDFRVSTVRVPFWNADFAQEQRDACRLVGLPE
jgi:TolB-like protein